LQKSNKEMEKTVKVKRSKFFYTQEEIQQLQDAINSKKHKTNFALAKVYAEKLDRSIDTIYSKVRQLIGKKTTANRKRPIKSVEVPVAKIEVIQEVKPLTLPQGMTYQGKAKTVELHADHFRVYF
jgi:hypothetical protein